jgi:DNA-binding transcriptional ArsR family regulator
MKNCCVVLLAFFEELGVPRGRIDVRNNTTSSCKNATIRSRALAFIFNKIFEIPLGKKGEIYLPIWYFHDMDFLVSAVRGAFDGEGCVNKGSHSLSPRRITICNKSQTYLRNLAAALKKIGIDSSDIRENQKGCNVFKLFIYGKTNLEKFFAIVKPRHDNRRKKLESLLKTYDKNRVTEGSLRKSLLKSLVEKSKRRAEIALELGFPKKKLGWHLKWLGENGLINVDGRFYTNNGSYFVYGITKNGKRFLSDEDRTL